MTEEEKELGKKRFGNFKSLVFVPETTKERLEVIYLAIGMLIEKYDPNKTIMDIDTLQFIIHRQPDVDGLTVGMKYEGWWADDRP